MDCTPPTNIAVVISGSRADQGGFMRIVPEMVPPPPPPSIKVMRPHSLLLSPCIHTVCA